MKKKKESRSGLVAFMCLTVFVLLVVATKISPNVETSITIVLITGATVISMLIGLTISKED